MTTLREQWLRSFQQVGIKPIRTDTAARILAILYVHGGTSENFTHNRNLIEDAKYLQDEYHIHGTGIVDADFAELLKKYVKELEDYEKEHSKGAVGLEEICRVKCPQWLNKLLKERYGFTL